MWTWIFDGHSIEVRVIETHLPLPQSFLHQHNTGEPFIIFKFGDKVGIDWALDCLHGYFGFFQVIVASFAGRNTWHNDQYLIGGMLHLGLCPIFNGEKSWKCRHWSSHSHLLQLTASSFHWVGRLWTGRLKSILMSSSYPQLVWQAHLLAWLCPLVLQDRLRGSFPIRRQWKPSSFSVLPYVQDKLRTNQL